ncbi:hypothetical protein E7T06_07375 [Deinococcus sp. Arct2-2]|nr:hypothetical protein E7T06_07375 [Deinococcus sp. Arct2-2]
MTYPEVVVEWRVPEILKQHDLTAYKLAEALAGKVNRNSAYEIAAGRSKRVDRTTLYDLIVALRTLTGDESLTVGDLFTFEESNS